MFSQTNKNVWISEIKSATRITLYVSSKWVDWTEFLATSKAIKDLKVMNDHLKKAANKMEKTPGSALATSKWKPNGFDPRMNPDAQEFRPTFGRPKIDKKKMKSSPRLENVSGISTASDEFRSLKSINKTSK